MAGQPNEVTLCQTEDCPLFPIRFCKSVPGIRVLTRIKAKCLDCSADNYNDVINCWASDAERIPDTIFQGTYCELYPFRQGKNPNRSGKMSPENRAKCSARMKAIQEWRKAGL